MIAKTATQTNLAAALIEDLVVTDVKIARIGDYPQIGFDLTYRSIDRVCPEAVEVFIDRDGEWSIVYAGSEELGKDCIWSLYDLLGLSASDVAKIEARFLTLIRQAVAVTKGVLKNDIYLLTKTSSQVIAVEDTLDMNKELILAVANS